MKRIIASLLVGLLIVPAFAKQDQLQDSQSLLVRMYRAGTIEGLQQELIDPFLFANVVDSGATDSGYVSLKDDKLRISYYNRKTQQLVKIESYDAGDYLLGGNKLIMDGRQSYYADGRLFCEELYNQNELKSVEWFAADGENTRTYLFQNNRLIQQLQFYPSHKIKYQEVYLADHSIRRQAFTEKGMTAEFQEPSFPGGYENFERYFNKYFRPSCDLPYGESTVCLYVAENGRCEVTLWDKKSVQVFADDRIPLWKPATIDGEPVSYTFVGKLVYAPFLGVENGDTVRITPSLKRGNQWNGIIARDCMLWIPTADDTCSHYAVCQRDEKTLTMNCYDQNNRLCASQSFMYAPNDSILNTDYTGKYAIWHPTEYHVQKITNGYNLLSYSLYNNDIPVYYEHLTDNVWDTVYWYYPDGQIKYAFSPKDERNNDFMTDYRTNVMHFYNKGETSVTFSRDGVIKYKFTEDKGIDQQLTEFYPTGEIKVIEAPSKNHKKRTKITYYNKRGEIVKPTFPVFPDGAKAIQKYVQENINLNDKRLEKLLWDQVSGTVEVNVEVDENGHAVYTGIGSQTVEWYRKEGHLNKGDIAPLILECLQNNDQPWIPGTIDGEPQTLRTSIKIKFLFSNK